MIRTLPIADSILSTTARDWGLVPRQPPGEVEVRSARLPGPDEPARPPLRGADRQRDALQAQ